MKTQPPQQSLTQLNAALANAPKVTNIRTESPSKPKREDVAKTDSSTVKLSSAALKLANAPTTKKVSTSPVIENIDKAKKTVIELTNAFQNNSSQALGSQSSVPSRVVKELLG